MAESPLFSNQRPTPAATTTTVDVEGMASSLGHAGGSRRSQDDGELPADQRGRGQPAELGQDEGGDRRRLEGEADGDHADRGLGCGDSE